tara:strand:- start:958 stop:1329 length:372 start_codon:yes stop_codon:yes gene_type:complete
MKVNKAYGDFIGQLPWNIFATLRSPYKINTMTPRRWFKKLMTTSDKVLSVFYSVEKDKGDPKSLNVHTLINSSTDLSYEEFRSGLGGVAVGDYDLIKAPKEVACYVTKYFGVYDVDYDIVFKS